MDLSASNEELEKEFVVQAFEVVRRGFTSDMSKRKDYGKMKVKVVDMLRQAKEQKVVINNLEKELKELQEFLSARAKSYVRDSPFVDDDEHLQTFYVDDKDEPDEEGIPEGQGLPEEQGVPDDQGLPKEQEQDVVEEQDVPQEQDVPEYQDGGEEKSNIFTRVKHRARKRVKSAVMKSPWTRYGRGKYDFVCHN